MRDLPLHPGARHLDDDCAVLELGEQTLVITHDMMVEGTHFRAEADMADVAWKLLTVNLSDLAAKGSMPLGVLLGHSLGGNDARFLEGFGAALKDYDVPLLGGDTVRSEGTRTYGLTAIGRATTTPVPSRSGARPGDAIWLCGGLGYAMIGFEDPDGPHCDAFNRPTPLLEEGQAIAPVANAMMDVSDGLLLDATRMAKASGVTFKLDTTHIDCADRSRLQECLVWGDDYALLFTCGPKVRPPVDASPIGYVTEDAGHPVLVDGAAPVGALGFEH